MPTAVLHAATCTINPVKNDNPYPAMLELMKLLQAIRPLSADLIEYLFNKLQTKQLNKGQYLLKAGQVCQHVYFLSEGLVRFFHRDKSATETTTWFMKKGDIFVSVESFYKQEESKEYIQALQKCEVFYLHITDIQYIYEHFPEFNYIGRVITEKYNVIITEYLFLSKVKSAKDRYLYFMEQYGELEKIVSAKDVASFLNISEPHLSTIKSKINQRRS